jgi:hypothetical protein
VRLNEDAGVGRFPRNLGCEPIEELMDVFHVVVCRNPESEEEAGHRGGEFVPRGRRDRTECPIMEDVRLGIAAERTNLLPMNPGQKRR